MSQTNRRDGRPYDALRPVSFTRHYLKTAPGSVLVRFGDTVVLCAATLSDRMPAWLKGSGQGWVTAEYAMLPASTAERIGRDNSQKGRAQEISRMIGRALRAVTKLEDLGECVVTVDCDVLQADGGTRTAAISGGWLALHDALEDAVTRGFLQNIPLTGHCAAVSVGLVNDFLMLDLDYEEDSQAAVDLNVCGNDQGALIEVQGCAEGRLFSRQGLNSMLDLALDGIRKIITAQKEALRHD
ncbi:MAG TPA: ribonuclease PH [Candidatus Hydrogenedentes bacterium]|nr:ribonuclease PH [Candidatus Hydrogenedentota bacterium]